MFYDCQRSEPRSKEQTLASLRKQLDVYLRGAPSTAGTEATASGVKDKYFQHFAEKLADACAQFKERQRQDPTLKGNDALIDAIRKIRDTMPPDDEIFNPALRLEGKLCSSHLTVIS